jgi:hypothetical protein
VPPFRRGEIVIENCASNQVRVQSPGRVRRGRAVCGALLAAPLGGHSLPGIVEPPPGVVDYALWVVGGVIVFVMAGFYVWGMIKRRR